MEDWSQKAQAACPAISARLQPQRGDKRRHFSFRGPWTLSGHLKAKGPEQGTRRMGVVATKLFAAGGRTRTRAARITHGHHGAEFHVRGTTLQRALRAT